MLALTTEENIMNTKLDYENNGNDSIDITFFSDGLLEASYTSTSKCDTDPSSTITSTIIFHCALEVRSPQLSYKSSNCQYIFDWHTNETCAKADV